ncbi:hypothetical protein MAR_024733 [Mya arenaria]|uniref:Uncharacterized protein n=1 Tax=Mya arenaria TaxID=6604 RepID=A0ABY7DVM4_MYAAR|nr:hypothetical protein MAR_024733 [Mya arenaria]
MFILSTFLDNPEGQHTEISVNNAAPDRLPLLLSIPAGTNEYLPLISKTVSRDFSGYPLLIERSKSFLIINFNQLLTASGWVRYVQLESVKNVKKQVQQRWRMDDDDFSCSAPSQSFILPASQEETQEDQPLSPGKRMRRTLANLPALQDRSGNLQSGRGQGSEQGQGLRFSLFPASQDIFSDSEEDEDNVLTPAAHLGSLQISQKPMLVPETVEDTTDSPTDQSDNQSDEKHENIGATRNQQLDNESSGVSFDFLADETLASESQIKETDRTVIHRREMERSDQLSGDIEKKTPEKSDEKSISSQSLEARLAMPTLVDDGGRKEPVYLNLTVSSTQPSQSIEIVDVLPPPSGHEGMRQVAGVSLGLATSQSLLGTEVPHRDIIVIPSGSAPSQHGVIESDDYGLRLSPSQQQSSRATQVSKNTDSHSTQSNSVHMTHSKKDLIEKESENSEIGEKVRGDKSAVDSKPTLSSKDSTESRKSASQGVEGKHCASEGQARRSSSEPRSFENNRESRRNKRMLDLLNNDPLVLWKNDSDTEKKILDASVRSSEKYTEEFHLEIPRESASDPVTEIPRSQHAKRCMEHMDSKSQPGKEPAITCPTEDKMAIENIHTDDDEMLSTRERDTLVLPSDPPSNHADPPSKPGDPDFVLASGQYLAQKIPAAEAMDDTQTYDPVEVGLMSGAFDHNKSQSAAGMNTEQAVDITESKDEVIVTAKNSSEHSLKGGDIKSGVHASVSDELSVCSEPIMPGNVRERRLTESSTQTQEGKPKSVFEGVDVNVVQKVAEYLTSGYAPRSRTNSTCTDISDQHGEGSEKSDSVMKTPQPRKAMDKHRSPGSSRMRRESSDQKSPQEVKDIVKTYSNILQKSAMKQKQREEMRETATTSSQRTNPESVLPSKAAVPRRLSTQSMPDGVHSSYIKSSQQFTATLNRTLSSQPDWITAKKPTSQGFITSKTPKNSSQGSLEIFPPKSLDKSTDNTKHESFPENSAESVSANIQASENAPETLHSVTIEDADLDLIGVKIMDSDIAKPAGIENASFPTVSSQNKQSVPLTETKNLTQKVPKHEQKLEISTKSTPVKVKGQIPQSHSGRPSNNSKKKKRLISVEKRNKIRRTLDSGSPQMGTGSFVSGTQKFKSIDSGEGKTRDPYKFESSQSQISPNQAS